jgi:hypothetical protein
VKPLKILRRKIREIFYDKSFNCCYCAILFEGEKADIEVRTFHRISEVNQNTLVNTSFENAANQNFIHEGVKRTITSWQDLLQFY